MLPHQADTFVGAAGTVVTVPPPPADVVPVLPPPQPPRNAATTKVAISPNLAITPLFDLIIAPLIFVDLQYDIPQHPARFHVFVDRRIAECGRPS
jgi:hypothetical protein